MTGLRFFHTDKPTVQLPLVGYDEEFQTFLRLRKERNKGKADD